MMIGKLLSFWDGLFSGAMLTSREYTYMSGLKLMVNVGKHSRPMEPLGMKHSSEKRGVNTLSLVSCR